MSRALALFDPQHLHEAQCTPGHLTRPTLASLAASKLSVCLFHPYCTAPKL
jgi:hypothetical protein